MSGSVLEKYLPSKPGQANGAGAAEADAPDDLGSFGYLRGIHDRALMLEVRQKDGTITAYPYAWLSKVRLDPSEGITLHFGGETVKITGRNLNAEVRPNMRLFAGIARHRIPWIQEADEPSMLQAPKGATVIEGLEIA